MNHEQFERQAKAERGFTLYRNRLRDILLGNLDLARLAVAIGSLWWAFVLLAQGPQFDRPSYYWLAQVADQWVWGVAFGACGIYQLARTLGGVKVNSGRVACVTAAVIMLLWASVTVGSALALWPWPGFMSGNVAITALQFLIFVRAATHRD